MGPNFAEMNDAELAKYQTAVDMEVQLRQTVDGQRVTDVQTKIHELYGLDVSPKHVRVVFSSAAALDGV